ncbi:MAG: phosphoribosylglycinamide formyltransferase [Thermoplasmata archaeon]|nr:phosphoribosylglycinamide formyltransferase [Euryarchaeota archaeon]MVT35664.1 phosphoribosylglycinamide formyltransferase [Euryarchaeota archaeon]
MNIGVLVSGRGTNLQAIIDASKDGKIKSRVVVVISNKKDAYALLRAEKEGIPAFFLSSKNKTPEEYDKEIIGIFENYKVDLVVLAGYLKILSGVLIERYKDRIINIHPALLPSFGGKGFYGENVHRAVLDAGCRVSGCTVHFVRLEIDKGPIIVQKCVEVLDNDTPETLAERILPHEHQALVEAIKIIEEGRYKIEGMRVKRI